MKSRTARLGVLLLAVIGIMGTMTPPASATTIKKIVFTGTARLDKGLGYPCTTNKISNDQCPPLVTTEVKTGPKGEPEVNFTFSNALHAGYDFSSTTCLKLSISVNKPAPSKTGLDDCLITSTGVVWGWCGLSTLMGVATLENLGPGFKDTISEEIKGTGVGGVLYINGGNATEHIYAVVSAVPALPPPLGPVGAGSCTNKTGNVFTLTGEACYKKVTTS